MIEVSIWSRIDQIHTSIFVWQFIGEFFTSWLPEARRLGIPRRQTVEAGRQSFWTGA